MSIQLTLNNAADGNTQKQEASLEEACKQLQNNNVSALELGYSPSKESLETLAAVLPGNTALKAIKMGGGINDKALYAKFCNALTAVPNLESFSTAHGFHGSDLGRHTADLVHNHPRLSKVDLSYSTLYLPGTQAFAPGLAHNGGLRELNISFNAMGAPGVDLLAKALETNKGLVKINVDTSYNIEACIPNVEAMLDKNKNLLSIDGLSSDTIAARLAENRAQAETLADALVADPKGLDKEQRLAIHERMAAVTYLMENEKGQSRDEVLGKLTDMLDSGQKQGLDSFPAMMTVLPFNEMLSLSEKRGKPLKAADFYDPKSGPTPLMAAVIERGAGAQLFCIEMDWESTQQLNGAYKTLPEAQKQQVSGYHQLRAQVGLLADQGMGRRMLG